MHGGKRDGAGRKKGVPNKASALRQVMAQSSGATPVEILLDAMRQFWTMAEQSKSDLDFARYAKLATNAAKDVAPYIHPKISASQSSPAEAVTKHIVEIIGGLPVGSTPENPAGTEYQEIPEEN